MPIILMISGLTPSFKQDSALRGVSTTLPGGGLMLAAVWVDGLLKSSSMDTGRRNLFLRPVFDFENPDALESFVMAFPVESGRPWSSGSRGWDELRLVMVLASLIFKVFA